MSTSNPIATFPKDPAAVLDYTVDWSNWLGLDKITSVVWTVPAGIGNAGTSNSGTAATIWISGGTAGTNYIVTCLVTTLAGRTDERSFQLTVVAR
jgi:hypothetical protein